MRSVLVGLHLSHRPSFATSNGSASQSSVVEKENSLVLRQNKAAAEAQQKTGFGSHLNFVISDCLFYL
jgi:hypothetical protein